MADGAAVVVSAAVFVDVIHNDRSCLQTGEANQKEQNERDPPH